MWLFDWVWDILSALGLYNKSAKILFLGLDNAGKSTLLARLKNDRLATMAPTARANMEELTVGKIKFNAYDLGGHRSARRLWSEYCQGVDCVVYIVDASDRARFQESKTELDNLLAYEEISRIPFVIFGNKVDLPGACSEEELRAALGLTRTTGKGTRPLENIRPIELFMTSIVRKQGYGDGFQWVSQYL